MGSRIDFQKDKLRSAANDSKNQTTVTVFAFLVRESEKALLICDVFDKQGWIPRSMIRGQEPIEGKPKKFKFLLPEWLAEEKGWV